MLLDRAEELLELDARARVLDLGAGTGRVTRELARRFERRRRGRAGRADARAARASAVAGSAEAIPLEDASVDAVFVGEAFHWFDPEAAIPEIARVLRPRGGLAILWTHWWETEPPLPERGARAVARAVRSLPAAAAPALATAPSPARPSSRSQVERDTDEITVDRRRAARRSTRRPARSHRFPRASARRSSRRVRPLLARPYRLPLKHELTWTRLAA